MANCSICGKVGDHSKKINNQDNCPICDDCNYYLFTARHAPTREEAAQITSALASNPRATKEAKEALREYFDPTAIAEREKRKAECERQDALKRQMLEEELRRVETVVKTMPITSGTSFEGYRIVKYGGYVSGDEVVTLSDHFFGSSFNKDAINDAIKQCRMVAIKELKQAAALQECNAVIGLDFDYINIDRTGHGLITDTTYNISHIILTANGTAVQIEKI